MTSFCIFILVLFSLCACGGSRNILGTDEVPTGWQGIADPPKRNYTTAELAMGKRICDGLKNKRDLFSKVDDMKERFSVVGEIKNCENSIPNNSEAFSISISNGRTNLEYISTVAREKYLRDVITDQNGVMQILCKNLAGVGPVPNTVSEGNSIYGVTFLIKNDYDYFEILKKSKGANGKYNIVSADAVFVITQEKQAAKKFFGVEKQRILYTKCDREEETSYTKQTWVEALTPFDVPAVAIQPYDDYNE